MNVPRFPVALALLLTGCATEPSRCEYDHHTRVTTCWSARSLSEDCERVRATHVAAAFITVECVRMMAHSSRGAR